MAVSPSLNKLLEFVGSVELNDAALAVFLRTGFFIDNDTAFRFIQSVPVFKRFEWVDGNLHIEKMPKSVSTSTLLDDKAVEGYVHYFREAMRRRMPLDDDFIAPISGGKDSRHILLEFYHAGRTPKLCLTCEGHPTTGEDDPVIAQRLTSLLNFQHHTLQASVPKLEFEL